MPKFKPLPCPACGSPESYHDTYDSDHFRLCKVCHFASEASGTAALANKKWNDRRPYTERLAARNTN